MNAKTLTTLLPGVGLLRFRQRGRRTRAPTIESPAKNPARRWGNARAAENATGTARNFLKK